MRSPYMRGPSVMSLSTKQEKDPAELRLGGCASAEKMSSQASCSSQFLISSEKSNSFELLTLINISWQQSNGGLQLTPWPTVLKAYVPEVWFPSSITIIPRSPWRVGFLVGTAALSPGIFYLPAVCEFMIYSRTFFPAFSSFPHLLVCMLLTQLHWGFWCPTHKVSL